MALEVQAGHLDPEKTCRRRSSTGIPPRRRTGPAGPPPTASITTRRIPTHLVWVHTDQGGAAAPAALAVLVAVGLPQPDQAGVDLDLDDARSV